MNTRLLLASVLALALAATACGNDKPAQSPESAGGVTETSSTKEDMPAPPSKDVEASAAPVTDTTATAAAPSAGGVIKLAALKVVPAKKGKDKVVELKEDGTVSIDGKVAAKIKGDEVTSAGGTSMLTVGVDGSLVGNGVKPGFKFEGDDLVLENGAKISVAEDGTIASVRDGKTEKLAKVDGSTSAKRASLALTVLYVTLPASVTAAPKKAPVGGAAVPAAKTK